MGSHRSSPTTSPDVTRIALLIGDAVRSRMLIALLESGELSASELAFRGEASAQAASAHLRKLVEGGLLAVRSAGRARLFRLASHDVAHAIETLASLAPATTITSLTQHTAMQRLRVGNDTIAVTPTGERFFEALGIDVDPLRKERRAVTRPCMDWTERRWHLAGSLGAALLDHMLEARWVRRHTNDRALLVTEEGAIQIDRFFGPSTSSG